MANRYSLLINRDGRWTSSPVYAGGTATVDRGPLVHAQARLARRRLSRAGVKAEVYKHVEFDGAVVEAARRNSDNEPAAALGTGPFV